MRKLLAVDADNLINRAFYAIPAMFAPDGTPTNALRGFCNTVLNLQRQTGATEVICAFDAGVPAFRKEAAPSYKSNRAEKPEDLALQLKLCRRIICKYMGWAVLWEKMIEADDLLFTMALRAEESAIPLCVASGDKDLAQCVKSENVRLLRPPKKNGDPWAELGPEDVKSLFGVNPDLIPDYLALTGDSCDNLPGVAGAGPKTVLAWLTAHGSLEGIIANKTTLAPAHLQKKIDPEQMRKNRLVTAGFDTGHRIPEQKAWDGDAREALKALGLHKIAQRMG